MAISLQINNITTSVVAGKTIFDHAEAIDLKIPTSCRKQGKCKECLVEVKEGMDCLSERVGKEHHLSGSFRLSCQCTIIKNEGSVICHTMRRGEMVVEKHALHLPTTGKAVKPNAAITKRGSEVLLDGEVIDNNNGPVYGIAMDLGTTTVVMRLLNLETGEIITDASFENPQRFGGSDVMARIQYDTDHPDKILRRTLAGYVNHAIDDFGVDTNSIYEMVIVGNSTMRDLFFGIDVYPIGQNPYQSVTEIELNEGKRETTSLVSSAKKCLMNINPKARIYGAPIISGHVGADAASCLLAVDFANEEDLVAIMDIGTNTELIIGNKDKIYAASCPAGPAFEGGQIVAGMPGLPGAIEKIAIHEDGSIGIQVIGNQEAEGICGSGLVELLSELLRTGMMNHLGRLEDDDEIIVSESEHHHIVFNESDINELAQAKGANVAGLHTVFNNYGIKFNDIKKFYLAGGFGRHLNVEASKRIGLIPNLPNDKIVQVGNASIEGACIALLSISKRAELEKMVRGIVHCRLETHPSFFDYFVEGCQFNTVESLDLV